MAHRRIAPAELERELEWVRARAVDKGFTGYDTTGWEASAWVLHSMYEYAPREKVPSHDELHAARLERGLIEPDLLDGISNDVDVTVTGIPVGMSRHPGEGWERLLWSDLAERGVVDFEHRYFPSFNCFGLRSWPGNLQPPCEGSLDEETLGALVDVLQTSFGDTECTAFYSGTASAVVAGSGDLIAYRCTLSDLWDVTADFSTMRGPSRQHFTPSNLWPADRSWITYTDHDLMATRVSGSEDLIQKLQNDDRIEIRT